VVFYQAMEQAFDDMLMLAMMKHHASSRPWTIPHYDALPHSNKIWSISIDWNGTRTRTRRQ
jgi:hypothetical protein